MILTLRHTQSNQWVGVDHANRIQSLNSPPTISRVEKKENDSDHAMYDMLEIYKQCKYIMWIINEKRKQKQKKPREDTHANAKQNRRQKLL